MKAFEFQLWDGFSNSKRIVYEESYDMAVTRYASNFPPAYIWSIIPKDEYNEIKS